VARRAVDELGRWLGLGLSNLVNTLNPSVIVLGGFFARLAPLVNAIVLEELSRRALPAAREGLVILPGLYGLDAPLYGAGEVALERLLADPTIVDPVAPSPPARRGRSPNASVSKSRDLQKVTP
jgi:predicted NBD/HSP70 family sugar kinase